MTAAFPRLRARPRAAAVAAAAAASPGTHPLGLGKDRDGWLHVPAGRVPDVPGPLLVTLHGAGSEGRRALGPALVNVAEASGTLVLAPDSRGPTWDVMGGEYGPDVAFLDAALEHVFARWAVDPARVTLAGFSDGASYALTLGLDNGTLFTRLIAFSPGFLRAQGREGRPAIFVAHGTQDDVLPIDRTSRRLVPPLRRAGYDVSYLEFEGGHGIPPAVVEEVGGWLERSLAAE